ncbi:unnamed protein product [Miscanthus lutarioriparius]|uniref:Disease resistance protein At4g27190-like leucine-rich repeats domain-containing protein n=1 Tax=Miscanthus lutarioriparius TaxID=422564 RepID=A0A811SPR4_9POAL|nr:unnamed protein product [Miscanthus lutarioriparius]
MAALRAVMVVTVALRDSTTLDAPCGGQELGEWWRHHEIRAVDVKTAVQQISPYLEDTSNDAPQFIYFDGWLGLGASAVLRAIAEQPPRSLREKFDRIIHIDCWMWKSRRALQRVIADELKLTQQVVAIDAQDEEDDFSGVDHGSRAVVRDITGVIGRYLVQYRCLVIFHNGSEDVVDLTDFGIPALKFLGTKVLWTFRGRLRLNNRIYNKVEASHLFLHADHYMNWNANLAEEAREISLYTYKLGLGVTPKIATECCLYLLSLNNQGKKMIDYNWATHASCYWVCDGIIGGQDNQTWEVAHALQQHIRLEDYSSNAELMGSVGMLDLSSKQWISITESYFKEVPPEATTLFFAPNKSSPQVVPLTSDKFRKVDQLRVLKLYGCTFSFSSPPFHCCRSLRFLGLDRCMDGLQHGEEEEEEKTGERAVEIFQRLWVLDVCHTDWPLAFPPETEEQVVATDIREVHITNGRIWTSNLAWRRLPNLHKLQVVEPTNPWETERRDEFMAMVNLELLDLSGNSTIQVLPSLSGATSLKTLILDGCVGLEHVGPQQLPPSLESFSLNTAGEDEDLKKKNVEISYISLAGCVRLANFILRGSLPNLEELDLSHTAIKILDLGAIVKVKNLQRLFLMGCGQLRSISWPKTEMYKLRLLCIDTRARGGEVDNRKPAWSRDCSLMVYQHDEVKEYCHASVAVADMRFLQSLEFLWTRETIRCDKWNLCLSSTSDDDGRGCHKEKMGSHYSTGQLAAALSLPKSLTYHDISTEQISAKIDISSSSSSAQFLPLDLHMDIGEGISDVTDKSSTRARDAIREVMDSVESLHVHDSSSITSVDPEHTSGTYIMNGLKWCCVERCPKLDTVFATDYYRICFYQLKIFWAAHLLMARSIWSRPRNPRLDSGYFSFTRLRTIRLHYCPRLRYVLPMAPNNTLSEVLETLHIHCCGDLKQVFLVEQEFLEEIAARHEKGMLEFSNLKSLYLYELPNLQQICEAKMFAPKLETIYIRGCWGLRRLPATDSRRREDGRPVAVDCEKDWWDKLEWDGMESGDHPSLFQPSHSKYYKRRHLRSTVLR